jgi:hypothetical protein
MLAQHRQRKNSGVAAGRGQATVEFYFVVGIAVTILFMVLPLIGDVIKQKSDDVHARQQATIQFDHGKYLGEVNLPNVYLPDLTIHQLIPNLPGFGIPDFSSLIGVLGFFGINTNIMDFLGLDGADTIMGNAFNRGALSYITSGFDSEAGMNGAIQGAIQSDQFGRWADSQWNGLFGDGTVAWEDADLQKGWGDNISWASDFSGSYTQGFMASYVGSGGDLKNSMIGGFAQGWQIKPIQGWLTEAFDGSDFWVGVTNGGVTGSLTAVGSGGDNALMTIGTSMASGGFMSKTVQGALFGTDAAGNVLKGGKADFGRGLLGSATDGAFMGALGYVRSGGKNSEYLYMGAAMSAAMFTAGYGYEKSGAKEKVDETTKAVQDKAKETVQSVKDATGISSVEETAKNAANNVKETMKETADDVQSKFSSDHSSDQEKLTQSENTGDSNAGAAEEDHDKAVADTVTEINSKKSDSTFGYAMAVTAIAAATFVSGDQSTGQKSDAPTAPEKNNTANNPSANNPPVAQNNPAVTNFPAGNVPNVNGTIPAVNAKIQLSASQSSAGSRLAQMVGGVRMPQDVNLQTLGSSKLVADLKTHRNQAVDMVKISIARRLMDDYQQQLINSGTPSSQAVSLLNDPKTKERIQSIVDDPRVEEAVKQLIDEALQDDNFMSALVAAKDDQVKQQALISQLKMRELERAKSSRESVFNRPEKNQTSKSLIERLRSMIKDWEIWS